MKVLVGVCGGIAAYKAAELVRELQRSGIEVQVAMTASAERFVTPLTFAALTGRPVYTSLWQPSGEATGEATLFPIEHISVAQSFDALVVAPATANTLAKFAHGLADDFLSTVFLATRAPVIVAPAMNVNMLQHPATEENLRTLEKRGVHIVRPEPGYLACGMTGEGRLAPTQEITKSILALLNPQRDLAGETVLITAGGTREPIDPVRYIGNRSSGKMGHALAEAAARRGGNVILITAASLHAPVGCTVVRVSTAEQMQHAVLEHLDEARIVIKAAAVSDFRPRAIAPSKLKREGKLLLELEPTPDIAQAISELRRPGTLIVAFAAETEDLEQNARSKLLRKGADAIVANDVSRPGIGFDSHENAALFLTSEQTVELPRMSKAAMADRILDETRKLRAPKDDLQPFSAETPSTTSRT